MARTCRKKSDAAAATPGQVLGWSVGQHLQKDLMMHLRQLEDAEAISDR